MVENEPAGQSTHGTAAEFDLTYCPGEHKTEEIARSMLLPVSATYTTPETGWIAIPRGLLKIAAVPIPFADPEDPPVWVPPAIVTTVEFERKIFRTLWLP